MYSKKQRGFTIIELLFAMSFLSVLLIIAMVSSLNIMRTYSKGLALKQVNQSGRAIGTELQRSLKAAQPPVDGTKVTDGRLCLGAYSYVWSVGGQDPYLYDNGDKVGFAKVSDSTRAMCAVGRPTVPRDRSVELLAGDTTLAIQSASLAEPASYSGYFLYSFTFTIATNDAGLLNDERSACRVAGEQQFCALNRFVITASARGV
jgi:prepilin-type N-terminal cleavage/methylation domain-containing protein